MGCGTSGLGHALLTGCLNSTVNELYKPVNSIFSQFTLSFTTMELTPTTPPEGLEKHDDRWRQTHLGRLLGHAMRRFDERVLYLMAGNEGVPLALANLAARDQISAAHVHITRHLALEGSRLTDLAQAAGMSKQAMGDLVDQCTAWGLVQREPDPLDARARRVVFTSVGLAWLQAFKDAVAQAEAERVLHKGIDREYNLYDLLKRPDVSYQDLSTLSKENGDLALSNPLEQTDLISQLEIEVKYAGYVLRQQAEVERGAGNESIRLPADFDYSGVNGLSKEVQQKLNIHKPETIGQAGRIQGITPAAISLLLVHLKKRDLLNRSASANKSADGTAEQVA